MVFYAVKMGWLEVLFFLVLSELGASLKTFRKSEGRVYWQAVSVDFEANEKHGRVT